MNLKTKTAAQLAKIIRRANPMSAKAAAYEWAERIKRGPIRSCIPKKKQRAAGLLPPVTGKALIELVPRPKMR